MSLQNFLLLAMAALVVCSIVLAVAWSIRMRGREDASDVGWEHDAAIRAAEVAAAAQSPSWFARFRVRNRKSGEPEPPSVERDELAYRIGVPGVAAPARPSKLVMGVDQTPIIEPSEPIATAPDDRRHRGRDRIRGSDHPPAPLARHRALR